jgi:hypothetical protein
MTNYGPRRRRMRRLAEAADPNGLLLNQLLPNGTRVLLTGSGKQFIERIGIEATRQAVLGVLVGENLRDHTEPFTRQRLTQISAGLIALFVRGLLQDAKFIERLSAHAVDQLQSARGDPASRWLAQWMIGLTGKSDQNVLRGSDRMTRYLAAFDRSVHLAAQRCREDMGELSASLGFAEDGSGRRVELGWEAIARLTTALGCQTLTIRGSEKSMYGKLFERLVLGSILTILGFQRAHPQALPRRERVFWLTDSTSVRETDATALIRPGKVVRFDIGFIGRGNPEIIKDKLTRFGAEIRLAGEVHSSVTFVVVDKVPETERTLTYAASVGAEIIQMSMQYWPRELARRLAARIDYAHGLATMPDEQIQPYLEQQLAAIPLADFLAEVSIDALTSDDSASEDDGSEELSDE